MTKTSNFVAPMPLVKETSTEVEKTNLRTFKVWSNPADPTSIQNQVHVAIFSTGTAEEWFEFKRSVQSVVTGQNLTTGPQLFDLIVKLYSGKAQTDYVTFCGQPGHARTAARFELLWEHMTKSVLPENALSIQRECMQHYMRKPRTMEVRTFCSRLAEMNGLLPSFSHPVNADHNFSNEDMKGIIKHGMPMKWQFDVVNCNNNVFDYAGSTLAQLCDEFERLERVEASEKKPSSSNDNNKPKGEKTSPKKKGKGTKSKDKDRKYEKYCVVHPEMTNHDTANCNVIKKIKAQLKEAGHPSDIHDAVKRWRQANMKKRQAQFEAFDRARRGASGPRRSGSNERRETSFQADMEIEEGEADSLFNENDAYAYATLFDESFM